ncbi:hypothetical protein DL95DRAFT_50246 [Leptodontidium sp. 2 PMI_412]|nr:hypothetical protein DL95DRAFT_50246 [Leptodontidium sp. 2 PMI_412]
MCMGWEVSCRFRPFRFDLISALLCINSIVCLCVREGGRGREGDLIGRTCRFVFFVTNRSRRWQGKDRPHSQSHNLTDPRLSDLQASRKLQMGCQTSFPEAQNLTRLDSPLLTPVLSYPTIHCHPSWIITHIHPPALLGLAWPAESPRQGTCRLGARLNILEMAHAPRYRDD